MAFKLHHAALAVAALVSMGAQAATYNVVAPLTPAPTVAYSPVTGSFADVINFTIASPNVVLGGSVTDLSISIGLFNISNISGLTASLFSAGGTDFSSLITASGSDAYTFTGVLADGAYRLNVSGTGIGFGGAGGYTYALAAAPVPEPETFALLLAGLGLIAGVARRRV